MANITLKGNPCTTVGDLPQVGTTVNNSTFVASDLSDKTFNDFTGRKVLNIFPSIDTPVCQASVRTFNEKAGSIQGVTVLNISNDLPFAQKRWCGAEGLDNVTTLSSFRSTFATDLGVLINSGPLNGLCSRAIVVLDENNTVIHTEQVPEIAQEPNYEAALQALTTNA